MDIESLNKQLNRFAYYKFNGSRITRQNVIELSFSDARGFLHTTTIESGGAAPPVEIAAVEAGGGDTGPEKNAGVENPEPESPAKRGRRKSE